MNDEMIKATLIAACLGALIGLERQWEESRESQSVSDVPGLRTFALWGLLGALSAGMSIHYHGAFLPVCFGALAAVVGFSRVVSPQGRRAIGMTTFAEALVTFIVGALCGYGQAVTAVVITVVVVLIQASKSTVHGWSQSLTPRDVRMALQFAAISGVVLPLVPNQGMGPLSAFNPFSIWMMVVLISGMGFAGYVAMRWLGAGAGIALTGLVGGLASSTAATLAFSRKSRENPELSVSCSLANLLACTVMIARVAVLVAMISLPLFQRLWLPMLVMAVPGLIAVAWLWFADKHQKGNDEVQGPQMDNPLSLSVAIKFALIYAVVVFLVKWVSTTGVAGAGVLWVSFFSGLTDMDAITLSLAQSSAAGSMGLPLLAQGIMVGAISNTLLKTGFAVGLGSSKLRVITGGVLVLTALAGCFGFYLAGR